MPYSVTIKNGLIDVALPNGKLGQGGQSYTLTDDEYLSLSPTASAALFASSAQSRTDWQPKDHGYLTWSQDPATCSAGSLIGTAGQVNFARVHLPNAAPVTSVSLFLTAAGATLTAGQSWAGLYTTAGALIGATADQSTLWASAGLKTIPLTGGPYNLNAGDYLVAFFSNGTTMPTILRGVSQAASNAGLTAANARYGTAISGQTTAMPASLGTLSSLSQAWWVALS